jgi:PAS domain S-box-containing protein
MSWSISVGWNEPPAHARVGTTPLTLPVALGWFIAYLLAGSAVLLLQREVGASFWYPPVTLGILIVSRYGWRAGAIVLFADSIISSFQFGSPLAGTVVGASTLLEAGLAAALLARSQVDLRLPDVRSLVRLFLLGAAVPTFFGVTHGSLWLLALGVNEPASVFYTWLTWWFGDAVTTTCLLPMLLIVAVPRLAPAQRRVRPGGLNPPWRQTLAITLIAITLCALAFGWGEGEGDHLSHSLKYLCFLPVIWAAITLGVPATSGLVALTSTLAVILSLFNGSPVGLVNIADAPAVLDIQLFMLTVGLGGMTLALALEGERAARAASQRDADALRTSEARLRQVLHEMPVLLDAFNADGSIIVWNREAERITGYRADEIVGNPRALELLYPDTAYRNSMMSEWARRGNNYRGWIWQIAHKDGGSRTLAWSNISEGVPIEGWATWGVGIDITEQRRAEDALREREARLRQIAETVREVFWIRDMPDGRIGYVSPMYEMIWGRSCESLYAHPETMIASVHPDDRERVKAALAGEALEQSFDERFRVVRPDGSLRWVWGRAFPILDVAGRVYRMVGVAEDITEQQAVDEELRAARALLAAFIEHMPAHVFVYGLDGRLQLVNRSWEQFFGQARAEVIGKHMDDIFPAALARWLAETNQQVAKTGQVHIIERALAGTSGDECVFQGIRFPIRAADGQVSGVGGIAIDITDRTRAEQSRRLLSAAQEQAGEGTVITDIAGTILSVNPAFERMSGYSAEELVGRPPSMLKSGQHDDAFYRQLWDTISAGEVWRGRFINLAKDGREYTVEATIAPIRGAGGAIEHYVAVMRDVTRELRLEAQFRQAQKMEAIGRLAGGVAHDFNNLLSVINGYSDLILDAHPDPDDPVRQDVEPIRDAGRRAAGLTRQLLVFSRHQTVQPETLDLNRVLAETEKLLRRLIGEDIEVVTYTAPDLWPISADRGQLEQVIMNLVVNARDAMPGGGSLRLTTSNVRVESAQGEPGKYVRLEVSDTGVGMSAEVLAHLFEPFYTTKEQGRGTGLGLATVHGIVTKSGGTVAVSSVPGRGTRFTVDLPSQRSATDRAGAKRSHEPPASGTETILLVEDEVPIRILAERILRAQGYMVLVAASATEALEYCAGPAPIQLLLTDVVMPDLSGQELAAAARRRRPDLAVLFMSGYPDRGPGLGQEWNPDTPLLAKPLTPAMLGKAVRAVLDKRAVDAAESGADDR